MEPEERDFLAGQPRRQPGAVRYEDVLAMPIIHCVREWGMPTPDTFSCEPIKGFVQKYLLKSTISIDPFSRNKRWATYTNDLNPATSAESHLDANDFLSWMHSRGVVADLVIVDPPYSPRQVKECYDQIGKEMGAKDALQGKSRKVMRECILKLLKDDGIVLTFGWNTTGMGKGFEIIEILLVNHGADHNDTICMAEIKKERHQEFAFPSYVKRNGNVILNANLGT